MRGTLVWVIVAGVLIAGCGGGSDSPNSGGSSGSSGPSAGDKEYVDPFQAGGGCLSAREIRQKVHRIASQSQNPERQKKAIQTVRHRAC
jgi:hypothetical protein